MRRQFIFRPVLTATALGAFLFLLALGTWQLKRLEWKRSLITKVETRINQPPAPVDEIMRRARSGEDMEYTPVFADGVFSDEGAARVFGSYEGAPGFFAFSPMEIESGAALYVNRGFVPLNLSESARETAETPPAERLRVTGYFRMSETAKGPSAWLGLNQQSADGYWFVRNPEKMAAGAGAAAVAPYYIDSFANEQGQWPKGGVTRLEFSNRHLEYALTWFGMAAALLGVWLSFSLQKLE